MKLYLDQIYDSSEIVMETVTEYVPGFDFDIYLPPNPAAKRPVMIALHAGGGTKDDNQPVSWAREVFARRGYVGISAEYKEGTGNYTGEKQRLAVQNLWNLNKWLRDHYADPKYRIKRNRIGMVGNSAGAITSLQSAIGLNNRDDPYFDAFEWPAHMRFMAAVSCSGAANHTFQNFIDVDDPPCYMYHGTEDMTVPFAEAQKTFDILDASGTGSTFTPFEGEGHKLGHNDEIVADVVAKLGMLLGSMVTDV